MSKMDNIVDNIIVDTMVDEIVDNMVDNTVACFTKQCRVLNNAVSRALGSALGYEHAY